jgi:hypothetical protein
LIANAGFLSVFSKDHLYNKNNRSEENQIIQSELKSDNLRSIKFLFKNFEVGKSFPSREKKMKKCKSVKMHRGP